MNPHRLARWLASVLVKHAQQMLPAQQAEWARAMVVEMEHIESDPAALRWSFGCVLASYREGIRMTRLNLDASRWLLGLEALVCLGPLTLMWMAVTHMIFTAQVLDPMVWVPTLISTLGPVGLLLALAAITLRRPVSGIPFVVLAVSFGLLAVVYFMKFALPWFGFDWRAWMLCAVLPCIACAHLALIAPGRKELAATHSEL